ncbi:hypothetical protein DWY69_15050 [Eisenbergiella massiliensis]|uniref:Uncharacterized protein n=1 Tax=Eisenbergiella massiliensis TaxID=1720294 RepID=A0A3E3IUU4_9FIRM|nr:hypothetical protein DWY69_15050 [Eisenbergiella massiliensis]
MKADSVCRRAGRTIVLDNTELEVSSFTGIGEAGRSSVSRFAGVLFLFAEVCAIMPFSFFTYCVRLILRK